MTPPPEAPANARFLTAEELRAELDADSPADRDDSWGLEFDQRHYGMAVYNAFWALVYLTPIIGWIWFYTHNGAELIGWGLILASCLGLAYCLLCFYLDIRYVDEFLTRRVRLIFLPGRIIWRRRSLLSREKAIFDHGRITEVHHTRPQRGQEDDRYLYLKYLPPETPAGTNSSESSPAGRQSRPEGEIHQELLYDLGWRGTCAWAAGLIREALAPRNVVFFS